MYAMVEVFFLAHPLWLVSRYSTYTLVVSTEYLMKRPAVTKSFEHNPNQFSNRIILHVACNSDVYFIHSPS